MNRRTMRKLRKSLRRRTSTYIINKYDGGFIKDDYTEKLLNKPNAGGNSIISELLSFIVLRIIFRNLHSETETELMYRSGSKIFDYTIYYRNKIIAC